MTKLTSSILLAVFCMTAFGQSIDKDNLEKYWQYRDRFRQKFSKIGAAPGESLPIKAWQNAEDNLSGMPLGSTIRLWDEMIEHGYYLMVLAMEYELLSRAGKDRTAVKNELYYALNAVNRVDYEAERYLSANNQNPSLNGFFLRDDVPPSFIENFQEEDVSYMDTDYSNPKIMNDYQAGTAHPHKDWEDGAGVYDDFNKNKNEASKDQLSGLLMGLRFVAEYVPEGVWVQPTSDDSGFNLLEETRAITQRMLENLRWNYQNYLRPRTDGEMQLVHRGTHTGSGAWLYEDIGEDMGVFVEGPHLCRGYAPPEVTHQFIDGEIGVEQFIGELKPVEQAAGLAVFLGLPTGLQAAILFPELTVDIALSSFNNDFTVEMLTGSEHRKEYKVHFNPPYPQVASLPLQLGYYYMHLNGDAS